MIFLYRLEFLNGVVVLPVSTSVTTLPAPLNDLPEISHGLLLVGEI